MSTASRPGLRVAVVSPHPVVPVTSGDRIRTTELMRALRVSGVEAELVAWSWEGDPPAAPWPAFYVPGRPTGGPARLRWRTRLAWERRRNPLAVYRFPQALEAMEAMLRSRCYDVVDFQHAGMWMPTTLPNLITLLDVDTSRAARDGETRQRCEAVRSVEVAAIEGCDSVVTLSQLDAERVTALVPTARPTVVPLGCRPTGATPKQVHSEELRVAAYVGSFDYWPNEDAAQQLIAAWPSLRSKGLERLVLAGRGASRLKAADGGGIELRADVANAHALLVEADVLVVPLRSGGGVRVKIIEAFALGVPVVSTAIGIEGLEARDGVHAVIVEHPEQLGEGLARLSARGVREDLAANARLLWEERYTPERMATAMTEVYARLAR